MDPIFDALTPEEYDLLKEAIPLITVLIAGADGNFDMKERSWAEKVTNIRSYSSPEHYQGYYQDVGETFQKTLERLIAELPDDVEKRQLEISRRLNPINEILDKLDPKVAARMYNEFLSFSRHVARASGGFLKFWTISKEEKRWVGLPMLREFVYEEEE